MSFEEGQIKQIRVQNLAIYQIAGPVLCRHETGQQIKNAARKDSVFYII